MMELKYLIMTSIYKKHRIQWMLQMVELKYSIKMSIHKKHEIQLILQMMELWYVLNYSNSKNSNLQFEFLVVITKNQYFFWLSLLAAKFKAVILKVRFLKCHLNIWNKLHKYILHNFIWMINYWIIFLYLILKLHLNMICKKLYTNILFLYIIKIFNIGMQFK